MFRNNNRSLGGDKYTREKRMTKTKTNNNRFGLLDSDADTKANKKIGEKTDKNKTKESKLLTIIKNNLAAEEDSSNKPSIACATDEWSYPMVSLTSWIGNKVKHPRVFESDEDEEQIGPEMRKIYAYLEQAYQENMFRQEVYNSKNWEEEDTENESEGDCQLYEVVKSSKQRLVG